MMRSTKITKENIGPVLFERSKRARRLNITIRPFKGVRVAVPRGVSFEEAEKFVNTKSDWIRKHLGQMRELELQREKQLENSKPINRTLARQKLIDRLAVLAKKNGFKYNKVFIKNQKTRWGSCSGKNNINLNMKLVNLPDELIDYVLLHELVHTKVKSHSKKFWYELDKLVGDAKAKDRELRKYGVGLS